MRGGCLGQGRALYLQAFHQSVRGDRSQMLLFMLWSVAPRHVLVSSSKTSSLFCTLVPQGHSWAPQGQVITVQSPVPPSPGPATLCCLDFGRSCNVWVPQLLVCPMALLRGEYSAWKTNKLAYTEIPGSGKISSLFGQGKRRGLGWGQCQGKSSILDLTMVLKATGGFGTAHAHQAFASSLYRFCRSQPGKVHSDRFNIYCWGSVSKSLMQQGGVSGRELMRTGAVAQSAFCGKDILYYLG